MKRVLIAFACILATIQVAAQEHLAFKGEPIDGEASSFVQKLNKLGFKSVQKTDDGYYLEGLFSGHNSMLLVESSLLTNTAHTVYVMQEVKEDWATLKNDYSVLKKGLTLKYGNPILSKEEFRSPYKEGDGSAYMAFKGGYADWQCRFDAQVGIIDLYIREQSYGELNVILKYEDSANAKKAVQELTSDL